MKIENLATYKGRLLLRDVFHTLRYEKQRSAFAAFFILLGICISGKNIGNYYDEDVTISWSLGVRRGLALWMEEILNRYYFSAINSFVYFGAAILLVLIALQRFTDVVDTRIVIGGVILEATMLLLMFLVMLFSPNEELSDSDDEEVGTGELIDEIGEIGSDFAQAVVQLENIAADIAKAVEKQDEIIEKVDKAIKISAMAVNPHPKMITAMEETNKSIATFRESLDQLSEKTDALREKQIEEEVRKEIERIVKKNLGGN
jgi:hypothetical protein